MPYAIVCSPEPPVAFRPDLSSTPADQSLATSRDKCRVPAGLGLRGRGCRPGDAARAPSAAKPAERWECRGRRDSTPRAILAPPARHPKCAAPMRCGRRHYRAYRSRSAPAAADTRRGRRSALIGAARRARRAERSRPSTGRSTRGRRRAVIATACDRHAPGSDTTTTGPPGDPFNVFV